MLEIWTRSLDETTELYLTGRPGPDGTPALFLEIADALRARSARILLERIFVQGEDPARLDEIRRRAYGALDDGVSPTWLRSPAARGGRLAGVLIQAIAGPIPVSVGQHTRVVRHSGGRLITISGLCGRGGPFEADASALFAEAATLLRAQGASGFERCARTWIWVDPIAEHYRDLNRARTRVFRETGLIPEAAAPSYLPASTGIGLGPLSGELCLEAIAAADGPAPIAWLGGGNQGPAFSYGSAFSRAAWFEGPAGPTVFISGTAAIGPDGATIAPGEIEGQIAATVENLRALLRELGLEESAIAQGVAYGVSEAVAEAWRRVAPGWPHCVVLADICRPDLCFELEVTVCPRDALRGAPQAG